MRLYKKKKKSSRFSLLLMMALLVQMVLPPIAGQVYAAQSLEGFTFTKTATKAEVAVGEEFEYVIQFAVDGATQVGKSLTIVDTVPSQFEILDGWADGGWDDLVGQRLTFEYMSPEGDDILKSGSSGILRIPVKAKATGKDTPISTTNTATATVSDGISPTDVPATADVTIKADPNGNPDPGPGPGPDPDPVKTYDRWETFKTQHTGLTPGVPIVGGSVTYTVGIQGIAGNTDPGTLTVTEFVDQLPVGLPAGATVIASNDGIVDLPNKTVTWENVTVASGGRWEAIVTITYPDDYGYAISNPVNQTNTVTASVYTLTGGGTFPKQDDEITTVFGPPVSGTPGLTKNREFEYRFSGQKQSYTIGGISNSGSGVNSPLSNLVLTDQLPVEMDYTSVKIPSYKWDQFRFETNNGWNVYSGNAGAGSTIKIGHTGDAGLNSGRDLILSSGEYLISLEWTFNTLPVGQSINSIVIDGIVRDEANGTNTQLKHGDTVTNYVTLSYEALNPVNPGQWDPQPNKTASVSFKINHEKPWLTANKSVGSGNFRPLSKVPFTLTVGNDIKATGPYINPVIYDLLPQQFDYYTNPKIVDTDDALEQSYQLVGAPAGTPKPKIQIVSKNFDGTGRTLVKWYWDEVVEFAPGTSFQIKYEGLIQAGTPQTTAGITYTNDLYITTADPDTQFWHKDDQNYQVIPDNLNEWKQRNESIKDAKLGFDPNPGIDEYFVHASASVTVRKASLVQSTKWNQGDLEPVFRSTPGDTYTGTPAIPVPPFEPEGDIEYTEYPYYSVTYEGGTADYKLAIRNSGNTRLGKIDVIDILPHIGDNAVRVSGTTYEARGSEWQPNLAEVMASGSKTFTSSVETGAKTVQFDLKSYYSKSVDQELVVNFANVSGSRIGWIDQAFYPPDDLTDIKSLFFEISGITGSDGAPGLAPGDYIVLEWKMDAPVGAPTNAIAWNSFAIQATEQGASGNDEGSKMLPTAPNKVGFIIDPDNKHVPLGEIGNFVWFDSNRDGTQDEEYPGDSGQGAGINGITVNLYKEGEATPFKSSKTGYHFDGRPGYYLFQGLEAGNYYVEFVLPKHYIPTIANALGEDPTNTMDGDSNKVTVGDTVDGYTSYHTERITLGVAGKNYSIDLGIVEAKTPPDPYPTVNLEKEITNVAQGTSQETASQNYVVVGNKVHYEITFTNTSTVTLHNIKIADQLDRHQSGFTFTQVDYAGEVISINGNSHSRADVITKLMNTGAEPYIIFKSLGPNERIVLTGEYTVTHADIDGTDLNNEVVVYYNESPEPIKEDAEIPTAGITVEKTGSAKSVSQSGIWIDYVVTIKNIGSYDLTNIVITDTKVPGIPIIPMLKAGEVKQISYSYEVTNADIVQGKIVNIVKADPDEVPPETDEHEVPVITSQKGSIGDYVWLDRNEDGIQNEDEKDGINGIIVKLYDSRNGTAIAQTFTRSKDGKAGYYLFQGLEAGNYYVQFMIPDDYGLTEAEVGNDRELDSNIIDRDGFTNVITIGGTEAWDDLTVDLGLIPRGKIGDYVWLDRNRNGIQDEHENDGINGIVVHLYKDDIIGSPIATTTTDDDANGNPGYYLFENLLAGDYYVQFIIPVDYEKTKAKEGTDPNKDSNYTDANHFTEKIVIGEVSGWVNRSIDLGLIAKGSIGDYVWLDRNHNGKQDETPDAGRNGITVKLFDKDKNFLRETMTANDINGNPGYYLFDQLISGQYYIQFVVPGSFEMTKAEADGLAPDEDSNKLVNGYTEVITIGENTVWEDLTIDLGLVYRPSPPITPPTEPGEPTKPTEPTEPTEPEKPTESVTPTERENPSVPITTPKDTPIEGKANVPDGCAPIIGIQPKNGTVTVDANGKWVYTPQAGYIGKDGFSIIVCDGEEDAEELFFEIDVEEVPFGGIEPPVEMLPKTGEDSKLPYQIAGFSLILLGLGGSFLKRRSRN